MGHAQPLLGLRSVALRCSLVVGLAACASAPPSTAPRTQVRLEPVKSAETAAAPLPALPALGGTATIAERSAVPRLRTLRAEGQPVAAVVRELAAQFGLQYNVDPSVTGTVNTTLRNSTLPEALAAIVPQGATYQITDGVIRVGPARLVTRIFSMDYVAISRVGTAATVIQRRLGTSGFNAGGAGAGGLAGAAPAGGIQGAGGLQGGGFGGADVISAVSVADAWEEIRVALDALVFDALPGGQQQTPQAAGFAGGGTMSGGSRPYSRVAQDGRRLIINPMAGTITIAAFPSQLEQVEVFIRTFEASIQRQVLIEAKIVEVNLDRTFEFGIDWNAVAKAGTANLTLRTSNTVATANNVEFTLSGKPGQIGVVLSALSTQGDVRVLSSPRVSALNNQRAVFDVTTGEVVFSVTQTPIPNPGGQPTFVSQITPQQVNVGIVLDVLPQIAADNTVSMNIRPVVTSVRTTAEFRSPDGALFQAPVIDTRESDTMARLRSGETIIIGGLMQSRMEKIRGGVPGLRSIPLLGRLFTSYKDVERKAELVIFLTPTIISGQPTAAR